MKGNIRCADAFVCLCVRVDVHIRIAQSEHMRKFTLASSLPQLPTVHEGEVTESSFKGYYQALGEVEPVDAIFVRILEGVWGVEEEQHDPLHRLGVDLVEKILERSTDNEVSSSCV